MTMRLTHSLALARVLLLFFSRRVLRMGILRSTPVRVFAAIGVAALLAICSAAAYYFLKPMVGNTAVWRLLFDTATISLVLWVQIAFLFVKILFINAEGILELSFQLPLTNRERSAAFMVYEASMTGVVVGAGSISLVVTALLLLGPAAAPRLLESIIFPVVLAYLALSIVYLLLTRLCAILRLRPIENILLVLTMFTLLVVYSTQMTELVSQVSRAYLDGKSGVIWVTSLSWISRRYGVIAGLAVAAFLAVALMLLALWLTPNQHVRHSRYLNVPVGGWLRRILGPYDWCLLRNSQTVVSASIALLLFGYLVLNPVVNPIWGFTVLSVGGLYQFAATQPLRILVGAAPSPWRIYGYLLRAQLVLLALFAVPGLAALSIVDFHALAQSTLALLGCVGGAILTICIGIVFPAEKDNPFSVFIGLSVTGVVLALAAIALGVLQLPPLAIIGCLVGASAMSIWYSLQGIQTSESRRRNAQGAVGHEFRHRVRAIDRGDSSDNPALPHVLDR
jgi:hypothetical protein